MGRRSPVGVRSRRAAPLALVWLLGGFLVGFGEAFIFGKPWAIAQCRRLGTPAAPLWSSSGGSREEAKKRREEEKKKLEALMAKQERKAVKKYLEDQARKEATSAARQKANATPPKSARKDAPWSKNNNSNNKEGQGAGSRDAKTAAASYSAQRAPPKRPNAFQQVSLTTRLFSVDDVRDMTFEGGYTDDVPFLGLPEIAVFGRSNVGKSSLLNCLAGASSNRVAVVSKTPGRTQQINLFKVHDSSGPVAVVVDLPGYGYAKLPKALQSDIGSQVRRFMSDRPTLRLAVLLLDSRREPQRSDLNMIRYFRSASVPLLVLATKIDKLAVDEIDTNLDRLQQYFRLPEGQPVPFSAITGLNRRTVWSAIRDACVGDYMEVDKGGREVE